MRAEASLTLTAIRRHSMLIFQRNLASIERLRQSLTLRIISTSVLVLVCYFIIGLQLAVVPAFVHLDLGYSPVLAGLAISAQYLATLATRPLAGRMTDSAGGKYTASSGLLICAMSGCFFFFSGWLPDNPCRREKRALDRPRSRGPQ